MSIETVPKFDQMRNAALIQALEKAWPGCEAQNKNNMVVFKHIAASDARQKVGAFIDGWNSGLDWAREQMLSALPFNEPGLRGGRVADLQSMSHTPPLSARPIAAYARIDRRDPRRSAHACAAIEALFIKEGE